MDPQLRLGVRVVLRELRELAERKRELIPGARVAVKENARGEIVIALIPPPPTTELPPTREEKRARQAR